MKKISPHCGYHAQMAAVDTVNWRFRTRMFSRSPHRNFWVPAAATAGSSRCPSWQKVGGEKKPGGNGPGQLGLAQDIPLKQCVFATSAVPFKRL
jgi:hypothetical protein